MVSASHFRWLLLLIVSSAAVVYLLGNDTVSLWDRDEPRYAQTSRQMLASGDWVVPRFLDTVRTAKPVLIYWCQASAMSVLGDNAFAARLPSVLAMLVTLCVLMIALRPEVGPHRAHWTAFILASSTMTIASAKMCLTDSVLLLWIVISQICIYQIWQHGINARRLVILGISIGLAGLTKGPVAPGVNLLTILALWLIGKTVHSPADSHRFDRKQLYTIVPVVMALIFIIAFPWLYLIQVRAPEFLSTTFSRDVVERMRSGREGHAWPPGFYIVTIWIWYFPWSILLPATMVYAWRNRRLPQIRFALAGVIGPWGMFELVAGKLPHYILPTFPCLAFLTADMLMRACKGHVREVKDKPFKIAVIGWGIVVAGASSALIFVNGHFQVENMLAQIASYLLLVAGVIYTTMVVRSFLQIRFARAASIMGAGMFALIAIFYGLWCPNADFIRLDQRLATVMEKNGAGGAKADAIMIDYKEPGLAFHQGGGLVEEESNDYLATTPKNHWPKWVILTQEVWSKTPMEIQSQFDVIGTEKGFAYSGRAQMKEVLVLRRK